MQLTSTKILPTSVNCIELGLELELTTLIDSIAILIISDGVTCK